MLHALVAGSQDPQALAELARGALRKKLPALREALHGRFGAQHALLGGAMRAKLEFLEGGITERSAEIARGCWPRSRGRWTTCARCRALTTGWPRRWSPRSGGRWRASGPPRASPPGRGGARETMS